MTPLGNFLRTLLTMSNIILTQIPTQSTLEFYIVINSMQLNPSKVMSTVKFINEII